MPLDEHPLSRFSRPSLMHGDNRWDQVALWNLPSTAPFLIDTLESSADNRVDSLYQSGSLGVASLPLVTPFFVASNRSVAYASLMATTTNQLGVGSLVQYNRKQADSIARPDVGEIIFVSGWPGKRLFAIRLEGTTGPTFDKFRLEQEVVSCESENSNTPRKPR